MDRQKKRKRTDNGNTNGGNRRETAVSPSPSPSEEEVDQFFAILRRMHVAIKYLQENTVDDVAGGQKRGVQRCDLDLNALPENGD
ncbi:protein NIM1-INTERACTING 2 [Lycium ferocissimum]|uniref:protein NIM1-INTERACTING 2 n=1 Tax=Lycium ferocissimum TaxID=112874 RepID=UPI0028160E73|nr:protein NIM1-INTERACTING 2 [Lycium ferocissimum]